VRRLTNLRGRRFRILKHCIHSPPCWGRFFSSLSFASITVAAARLFMLGTFLAEFGYMVCWKLRYHNDLNIQGLKPDASEDERKRCVEEKARIFEHGGLHRLWEWENAEKTDATAATSDEADLQT